MGCNCNKPKPRPRPSNAPSTSSGTTQTFSLTTQDGRVKKFGSRLEAEAAKARLGGRGTVS